MNMGRIITLGSMAFQCNRCGATGPRVRVKTNRNGQIDDTDLIATWNQRADSLRAMEVKKPSEYPSRSLTPEHDARGGKDEGFDNNGDLHPEISAAYDYVQSVLDTSDFKSVYAWHGWALREAFLAGISSLRANIDRLQDHQQRLIEFAAIQALDLRDFADNSDNSLECWRTLPEQLQTALNAKELELDDELNGASE